MHGVTWEPDRGEPSCSRAERIGETTALRAVREQSCANPDKGERKAIEIVDEHTAIPFYVRELLASQGLRVPVANPCNCIGPQDGQPLCPCQMRGVIVRDGRYVMPERDLGPALDADELASVKRQREQIERDLAQNMALTHIPPLR